jgi:hypothetical protein
MTDGSDDMTSRDSSAHLTGGEIDRFRRRALAPGELVAIADHLAGCGDCRARVATPADVAAAGSQFETAIGVAESHVPEDDVHAYVDGTLDSARRVEVEAHLEQCAMCADEIKNLQQFARQDRAGSRGPAFWWSAGLAAAAALFLGIFIQGRMRPAQPVLMVLNDGAGRIRVDALGNLDGVNGLPADDVARLRQAIVGGRLTVPPTIESIAASDDRSLRGPADSPGFRVIAPVATAVLSDRPSLRWTPLSDEASYIVRLRDEATGSTVTSPPLRAGEWVPDEPLARGNTYVWQVEGSAGGREVTAPAPPAPAARFVVLAAADAARLARAPVSHFVRGVLYADAGLLDDAERELAELKKQNPESELVRRFVEQLAQARQRTGSAGRP